MAIDQSVLNHGLNCDQQHADAGNVTVAVVMVPVTAQGHLNQLLHLSRLISGYNIPVHFLGTTMHVRQARTRVHGWDPLAITNINFQELPTPHFINPPPNPHDTHASTKFPIHIFPSLLASLKLREPVYEFVLQLAKTVKRIVVIYDSLMVSVVQDIASIQNAESYCFESISAFWLYANHWEITGKPLLPTGAEIVQEFPSLEGCFPPEFDEIFEIQMKARKFNSGNLYNTSRVIEDFYLNLLAEATKATGTVKSWAIGPFNPVTLPEKKSTTGRNICLEWLDKQEMNSVLFVSFGTTCSFSDEQIYELAHGLEKSEQQFIWVLRYADKGNIFDGDDVRRVPLPEGYEERVKERGLIVRDWAPQLEILGHPSTGGFISHCGWNSCIESISMGVPIGTWPMHSDQPANAVLITRVLKLGVEVMDWARRDEVVSSVTIEMAVRRIMASAEGDEIRKRASEMGEAVRKSVMEGGSTRKEMDSFIDHITR